MLCASAQLAHAAPCTSATPVCTEWLSISGSDTQRALVYRSHALDTRHDEIERALIMVHGQSRNADGYFRYATRAARLAGARSNTIVIAPKFASNEGRDCRDSLEKDELNWVCEGPQSWRNGGAAIGNPKVTSYHLGDEILQRLARKDLFPNLRSVVLAGHSAGGQYTTRYSMSNQSHERIGIPIRYVVANPSSYTYPDALRPTRSAVPQDVDSAAPGYSAPFLANPPAPFQPFADSANCTTFDQWPYGLQKRVGYSAQFPAEQLVKQLTTRPTIFLVGELDTLPVSGFDSSCPAMAQGPNRLARGIAYARYLNEHFGARHPVVVVPACGHQARCMFTQERVLPLLFPAD